MTFARTSLASVLVTLVACGGAQMPAICATGSKDQCDEALRAQREAEQSSARRDRNGGFEQLRDRCTREGSRSSCLELGFVLYGAQRFGDRQGSVCHERCAEIAEGVVPADPARGVTLVEPDIQNSSVGEIVRRVMMSAYALGRGVRRNEARAFEFAPRDTVTRRCRPGAYGTSSCLDVRVLAAPDHAVTRSVEILDPTALRAEAGRLFAAARERAESEPADAVEDLRWGLEALAALRAEERAGLLPSDLVDRLWPGLVGDDVTLERTGLAVARARVLAHLLGPRDPRTARLDEARERLAARHAEIATRSVDPQQARFHRALAEWAAADELQSVAEREAPVTPFRPSIAWRVVARPERCEWVAEHVRRVLPSGGDFPVEVTLDLTQCAAPARVERRQETYREQVGTSSGGGSAARVTTTTQGGSRIVSYTGCGPGGTMSCVGSSTVTTTTVTGGSTAPPQPTYVTLTRTRRVRTTSIAVAGSLSIPVDGTPVTLPVASSRVVTHDFVETASEATMPDPWGPPETAGEFLGAELHALIDRDVTVQVRILDSARARANALLERARSTADRDAAERGALGVMALMHEGEELSPLDVFARYGLRPADAYALMRGRGLDDRALSHGFPAGLRAETATAR